MAGFFARGTMKPPLGAQVNPDHPFAQNLRALVLFADAPSWPPQVLCPQMVVGFTVTIGGGGPDLPVWASNAAGGALRFPSANSNIRWGSAGLADYIPTGDCTIAVIRRKLDTSNRSAAIFGTDGGARCGLQAPYSDGVASWDYGSFVAPNRLDAAGLTYTTNVERWVVTAGLRGSTMWQNGVKVASQDTAITRSASTNFMVINGGNGSDGDVQEVNFFQMSATQWSDPLCQWWSAEPYAHLYSEPHRAYDFLGTGGGPTVIESVGTAAGTSTVAGVGAYRTGSGHKSGFGAQKKPRRHNR